MMIQANKGTTIKRDLPAGKHADATEGSKFGAKRSYNRAKNFSHSFQSKLIILIQLFGEKKKIIFD